MDTHLQLFDTQKIFELNPNMKIKEHDILGIPVIVIDDFYKNPELVRDLCFKTPVKINNTNSSNAFNGYRGVLGQFLSANMDIFEKISKITLRDIDKKSYFKENIIFRQPEYEFIFNAYDHIEDTSNEYALSLPHTDPTFLASVVYLNTPDEPYSGTGIYRNKIFNKHFIPLKPIDMQWYMNMSEIESQQKYYKECMDFMDHIDKYRKEGKFIHESDDEWELLFKTEGKWNQMVLYPGSLLHSPIVDYKKLKEHNYIRLNQVMFLDPFNK